MKNLYLIIPLLLGFSTLWGQPPNDNCADAIAIGEVDSELFTTVDATTDGPIGPLQIDACPGNADADIDSIYNDVWYLYTPSFTGTALWSLCGQTAFDSKIAVYNPGSACPPSDDDLLGCNEDGAGQFCSDDAFESEIFFDVTEGETYLLRLGGYGEIPEGEENPVGTTGSGGFSIEQFISSVSNDMCADAIALELGETQAFTNVGATTDGPSHPDNPCFGFGDDSVMADIWYTYTAEETGSILWSTCDMAFLDTRLAVYNADVACPVSDADLHACNDDGAGCPGYSSLLFFDVVAGSTYLLRLGGWNGDMGTGDFDLVFMAPPDPPENDLCENAIEVEIIAPGDFTSTDGDNSAAGFDNDTFIFPTCLGNTDGGEFAEVWYSFNTGEVAEIEISFLALTVGSQFFVDLWENCEMPVDSLALPESCFFIDSETQILNDTIGPLLENTDYIMRVVTRLTSDVPGEFSFQLFGDVMSGNDNLYQEERVVIAPNPTHDYINVNFPILNSSNVRLKIHNVVGQLISKQQLGYFSSGDFSQQIDVSQLSSGVYFGTIQVDDGEMNFKFIKE